MTWSETVELVQNIVIIIWFLWPARYRMKNACVVRHSHGDWTIKSLIQYLLPRAECEDKGILHWSDAINAINGIGASHLFDVKLFRVSLHISMKSLLELLYKNRISLKIVRLIFSWGSNTSKKNVAFTPSAESTRKGLLGRTGLKKYLTFTFFPRSLEDKKKHREAQTWSSKGWLTKKNGPSLNVSSWFI